MRRSNLSAHLLRHGGQMTSESSNFELPIRFQLTPSKRFIAVLYLSHSGALAGIYFSNISVILSQLMCLIAILSLVYSHYKMFYLLKKKSTELILNSRDEWYICEEGGELIPVDLLPDSYVHTHLVVLMFRQGSHKRIVILTSDNISKTTCRRLRVRLRFTLSDTGS